MAEEESDSSVKMVVQRHGNEEEEKQILFEDVTVLDFDMLCSTVALQQARGFSAHRSRLSKLENQKHEEDEEEEGSNGGGIGGVQRMWEGGLLDCFDHQQIAIETACCPCYRFGKNIARADLGSCFLQGAVYVVLVVVSLFNLVAFGVTNRNCFLYLGLASIVTLTTYLGYFRTRIRKQFNIRGSTSSFADCVNHLICPCCTLCQEARTLELNNVQGGVWCGRGDTICIGSIGERSKGISDFHWSTLIPPTKSPGACSTSRSMNAFEHSWTTNTNHSEPLVDSGRAFESHMK